MFITVESGLNGNFFVILADRDGPIERLDCCDYEDIEEARKLAKQLAGQYCVRYLP